MMMSDLLDGTPVTSWLVGNPVLGSLAILVTQILVIAIVAVGISRLMARRYPGPAHTILLAAVLLVLAIGPIRMLGSTWRWSVVGSATAPVQNVVAYTLPPRTDSFDAEFVPSISETLPEPGDDLWQSDAAAQPSPAATAELAVPVRVSMMTIAAVIYIAGVIVMLSRFAIGTFRLRRAAQRGRRPSRSLQDRIDDQAQSLGMASAPRVRLTDRTRMPLVFGLFRPTVLVPGDFESWSSDEQSATLLHEWMHIRRRDMVGQWLSLAMRAMYWFHPATWWLDRHLTRAREWATDGQVVRCGMSPSGYAHSLLAVVSRMGQPSRRERRWSSLAIPMSASSDIEGRLHRIMRSQSAAPRSIRWACFGAVGGLVGITIATTGNFERASAQQPSEAETAQADQESSPRDEGVFPAGWTFDPVRPGDENMIRRVENCSVSPVNGDDYDSIWDISGQVVAPDGSPVAGAIVVMQFSTQEIIRDHGKAFRAHWTDDSLRLDDVLARTIADQNGNYSFQGVKTPALSRRRIESRWEGSLIAASPTSDPSEGVGWIHLQNKNSKRRIETDQVIRLQRTVSLSGRYVTEDGVPIGGAVVTASRLLLPSQSIATADVLDLTNSQLSPRTFTSADGSFRLDGIVESMVVSVGVTHPDWAGTYQCVASSDYERLSSIQDATGYLRGSEIRKSPVDLVADPGVWFHGKVSDPDGKPVQGAVAVIGAFISPDLTDASGAYRIRCPLELVKKWGKRVPPSIIVSDVKAVGLVASSVPISPDNLDGARPIDLSLQRGVSVSGRVVDEAGLPVSGATVSALVGGFTHRETTDDNGRYEYVIAPSDGVLVVSTNEPGFALPSDRDALSVESEMIPRAWPQVAFDVSDGQSITLPTFTVKRTRPINVIASLPDGTPAVGASAVIVDQVPRTTSGSSIAMPSRKVDLSQVVTTNALGRADLVPIGVPTEAAAVQIKLVRAGGGFDTSVPLANAVEGVLSVVLDSAVVVQGRVTLDGKPVRGAKVSIGKSTPFTRTVGGVGRAMGATVSDHEHVVTDASGTYRLAVTPDHEYSVSVKSFPDKPMSVGIGFRAIPGGDGNLNVKTFAFVTGTESIAGRVVDPKGVPVVGARVSILRTMDITPDFWLGHSEQSLSTTDVDGNFHLKNMPAGTYSIRVSEPRVQGQTRRSISMRASQITTGTMNAILTLDTTPTPATPRLQPKRITPTPKPPSASEKES